MKLVSSHAGLPRALLAVAGAVAVACGGITALPAQARSTIRFAAAVNYPTGSSWGPGPAPVGTVAGDVDGDDDADVVIADPMDDGPLLLRNRGNGTFGPSSRIEVGSGIGSLAAADLDRDGRLDLVARSGREVIALCGDGRGGFTVADRHAIPIGAQQQAIAVRADRDAKPDIVTTTPFGIQVLLGRGDATFETGPFTEVRGMLADVAAARFDRDRDRDLAVADATPLAQRAVALRGRGDGSFTETGSGAVGYGPEAIVAGDLDGNGLGDIVTADSFAFTMSVLLSDGHGGFEAATAYPVGDGPVSAALADFEKDGDLDVAVSAVGEARVVVFSGDGAGRFAEAARLDVTDFPQTPVVADFDGDGRPDLAVAGPEQLSVLRNVS